MATTHIHKSDWLTNAEAGRLIGASHMSVSRWVRAGHFPNARRFGRGRISRADVLAFIKNNRLAAKRAAS